LSLPGDIPVADRSLCITCFCCQELCPEKAITLVERKKIPADTWGS
jgi:formate hydrogenlyase subunit 6/NADH:ubiquinone oxidoreductase subunit I